MRDIEDKQPVRRSDLRYALGWILHSRARAVAAVILLGLAGAGSALGMLRWQGLYFRWSFAVICWLTVAFILIQLSTQHRQQK